jgi:hypothetical protein
MSLRSYANAPATTLASSCTSLATSIVVTSTTGLPITYPFILILDRGTASEEVVLCTAAAGTTLTVTRGYDSTPAFSHSIGGTVVHGISAIDPREANAHVNGTSGVHGVAGSVVGTTDAQTVTNKNLTSTTNTFPNSNQGVVNGANVNAAGTAVFKRTNVGIVNLSFVTTGALVSGNTVIILPGGYSPAGGIVHYATVIDTTTGNAVRLHVNADSTVTTQNSIGNGVTVRGQIIYPL